MNTRPAIEINNQPSLSHIAEELAFPAPETEKFGYVSIHSYSNGVYSLEGAGGYHEMKLLEDKKPLYIILYDPNLGFIRRLEIYKAMHPELPIKVYFMMYDNSIEETQYLAWIRREKAAFEKLIMVVWNFNIKQKSTVAIPIDSDGRVLVDVQEDFWKSDSRNAGGQLCERSSKILVDIREFRSSLPSLIHAKKMNVVPCTLAVGDYVLSPSLCVERKSLSDLSQSLRSGRLYTQCESMQAHYSKFILLIEFDARRSFRLLHNKVDKDLNKIDEYDICTRLTLLLIHFPKLRVIWSEGAHQTAEIFKDIKVRRIDYFRNKTAILFWKKPLQLDVNLVRINPHITSTSAICFNHSLALISKIIRRLWIMLKI